MKKKVLLISSANPYPVVTNGCERLVMDYQQTVFSGYDVYFIATDPGTWISQVWFCGETNLGQVSVEQLFDVDFVFAFFVGFKYNDFTKQVTARMPSFCLTNTHPHDDVPDGIFKGILSHRVSVIRDDILQCGGSYNSDIFYKDRMSEDFVLSVGRIHPDKNQLDLVRHYRDRIYDRHGLPLYLVGGTDDAGYYRQLCPYIDQVSVRSTIDPEKLDAPGNWRSPQQIAALCNRARFYVTASPKESFGIALVEALACGTTCVVNGEFWGFEPADLRPHVFGNITGRRGSILDLLEDAFARRVRLNGSEWVKKYSIRQAAKRQMEFIERRLQEP
jgi:glycosyltransferase involved in cell wall biosynthesis